MHSARVKFETWHDGRGPYRDMTYLKNAQSTVVETIDVSIALGKEEGMMARRTYRLESMVSVDTRNRKSLLLTRMNPKARMPRWHFPGLPV